MLIFAKRCAAVVGLAIALSPIAAAQQDAELTFPGQEEVAAATDFDQAMEQLYGYALTVEEVDYFLTTLTSLEAWSRSHQFVVKGCFDTMPIYEAIHSLPFWKEMGRDSMPFATVYTKILMAYLYADPAQNVLANTKLHIEQTEAQSVDPDLTEEEREFAKQQLIEARAHLALLETIPPGNGQLYAALQTIIDPALEHFAWLPEMDREAPEIFTLSSIGMRARGTGMWTRNKGMANHSYGLMWPACSMDIMVLPWTGGVQIDDATIGEVMAATLSSSPNTVIGSGEADDVNGRRDVRLQYHNPVEKTHGLAYLTTANDKLYILLYGGLEEDWDLLQPIIEESYSQLEFGEYPMPLLLDRTLKGYQIFAEEPWTTVLDKPINIDLRLTHGSSPLVVDISAYDVDSDSDFSDDRFQEFVDYIHSTNVAEYIDPQVVQAGVFEFHGLPCGISDIYGIQKVSADDPEAMILHQRQVFVYRDHRFIHFNVQAAHQDWGTVLPIAEQLLEHVKLVEPKRKVLLDQSAMGYIIEGEDGWQAVLREGQQPEANLLFPEPEVAISITRVAAVPRGELKDKIKALHDVTASQYANIEGFISEVGELCGVPAGWSTFEGELVGAEENGEALRVYSERFFFLHEGDMFIFNMMTRNSARSVASDKTKTLLEGLSFVARQ
ncbi:MAG: hypothetical protein GY747_12130 [Planctomycetes bacterium]|nr:hypothetical protein [Planctomycetota bacterium]MCP4771741.1 hypothetical protein [Planctomycetota bacterium]MCP4861016.1 hypothetical protein [Planctomycetota bacterium]